MQLSQLFIGDKITQDLLSKREGEGKYWDGAIKFVKENWNTDVEKLSSKQYEWAYKIMEDMVEWRIEKRL